MSTHFGSQKKFYILGKKKQLNDICEYFYLVWELIFASVW